MAFMFENLQVYQKAVDIADGIADGIAGGSAQECAALLELGSGQKLLEPPQHRQRSARLARGGDGPACAGSSLRGKA